MLIGRPQVPRDQRATGNGSLRRRLRIRHESEIMYDDNMAATLRETRAFNATVEPILMSESNVLIMRDTRTELRGMFQPGLTYSIPSDKSQVTYKIQFCGTEVYTHIG